MMIRMRRLHQSVYGLATVAILMLSGCSSADNPANDAAAVEVLNAWWKEFTYASTPVKAGTVTLAHTITSTNGRAYSIPEHMQTKREADEQAADARLMAYTRALVQSFRRQGSHGDGHNKAHQRPADIHSAQDVCRYLGAFVWANDNRQYGLEDIKVTGANGELLSMSEHLVPDHNVRRFNVRRFLFRQSIEEIPNHPKMKKACFQK